MKSPAQKAKKTFEDYVAASMAWYKVERYGGPLGLAKWTKDLFVGLPDEVNRFFVKGKEKFTEAMEAGINVIATHVAGQLNLAQNRIKRGKNEVTKYVEGLPKNLRHLGKEAASEIQDKFSALQDDVNSREEALIDTLAQEYVAAMQEVDERIEEMKAENRGLIDSVMGFINGVIDTINKLVEMITNLFAAIKSVIGVIIQDPIGFMGNLFDGIGKGIDAFKANIQTHLLSGLLEWLTGSLGPMGIVMPKDIFSLSGIFNLVFQVLGLGWDYIRLKAVKMMGEPVVKALEGGYDMFKTFATKGIDGIWEFLKDKFSDLKEIVIDAIKDMLITQVIQAGIKWLLSLLIPGAGFIKAIMAIKDLIVFFVESAMMLIPAITEAILALAAGSVAGVAKAIEFGLAKLIGLVINLFAKLIGLGGLTKKVQAIFKKIRKRVDKAVGKLLKKARKAGRRLMRKLGIGKKSEQKGKEERSKQEMEKDLATAVTTAEKFIANENNSDQDVQKKLEQLKQKYDLKVLKLVFDKQDENEETVHIHGEVNPNKDSKKIKRRKKVKKGTLIHEMSEGAWSEYSLRVTRVVNQHKFFAKAKGQSEKQFDNAGLDTTWKKYNPYKRGEAWEAIKDGSEWSNYADARQVLNYRKHNRFDNPAGKDWHHIVEQSNPNFSGGELHNVTNLGLVDSGINRGALNQYFNNSQRGTGIKTLRQWLKTESKMEAKKRGIEALKELGLTIKKKNEGRGEYQEIQ